MERANVAQTSSLIGLVRLNSATASCNSLRNASAVILRRAEPMTAKLAGSRCWSAKLYRAGMSLRAVRSPDAPNMTRHAGSGVRVSRRPSRNGFATVTVTSLTRHEVAARGVTRGRGAALARSWRRRRAVRLARSVRAGWAQMLARGAPRRPRHAARRGLAQALSLLYCVTAELIPQGGCDFHRVRVILS